MKPQIHGNPSKRLVNMAVTIVSTIQGENARRITVKDNCLRAAGSRPSPARRRITTSAMFLSNKILKKN